MPVNVPDKNVTGAWSVWSILLRRSPLPLLGATEDFVRAPAGAHTKKTLLRRWFATTGLKGLL